MTLDAEGNETAPIDLENELNKTQIILAYVLQEVGDVVIPMGKSLTDGVAIAVDEDAEAKTLTVRLVTE